IERAMLARLSEEHKEAFQFSAILSALVHGIAPLLAALLPIIPFAFLDFRDATIAAILVTFVLLFVIGAYLGNLVRERVIVTGLRFVAAGLGTAVLLWLMGAAGGKLGVDRSDVEGKDVKLRLTSLFYEQLVDLALENGYRKPQALLRDLVRLVGLLGVSEHIRDVLSGTPRPKT